MANDKTTAAEQATTTSDENKAVETPVVDVAAPEAPAETSVKDVSSEQAPEAEVQEAAKEEAQAAAKAPEAKVAQPQQKATESPRQNKSAQVAQATQATKIQSTQTLAEPVVVSPQVKKIDPAAVNTPAPKPTQQVTPVVNRGGYEGEPFENEKNYLDKLGNEGTVIQKRILAAVQGLYNGIRPKAPIKPEEGAAVQERFLGHVLSLLDKSQEEFNQGWNVLLLFFLAYHDAKGGNSLRSYTAISEYRAADFGKNWRDFQAFEDYKKIIHLLRETRNRDTRKQNMKNISLATFMKNSNNFTEERINKLRNFYDN